MPAIFFRYELSPIRIQYTIYLQELSPFFVHICAIIGGIYAVSSIFESVLRNSLSIFAIGAMDETHNKGVKQTVKKVKKTVKTLEATKVDLDDDMGSALEMTP